MRDYLKVRYKTKLLAALRVFTSKEFKDIPIVMIHLSFPTEHRAPPPTHPPFYDPFKLEGCFSYQVSFFIIDDFSSSPNILIKFSLLKKNNNK